ncbi:hypothetical protein [Klebsiella oxytoca]|uniref:hypothetical protein n=1 Tax=Klebsiella oxytoca TaxID=571 RepID=UPI001B31A5E3|nr:hypothetical protein [Klebsiella oxytoca]EJM1003853.1 hypothetical protein [Klebsiella oxytoca]EKQ7238932.1 hypothetical protein [Klebsiella oxytoca]WBD78240.1 hypothetical protein OEE41_03945 [Klebsiella oxytoca]HBC8616425.1 hypothetical protein [Klebsiella oxytoca]
MQKLKRPVFLFMTLSLLFTSVLSALNWSENNNIECYSHITVLKENHKLTMMLIFSSLKNRGQVEINGFYRNESSTALAIHRLIQFNQERHSEQYTLTSVSVRKYSNDEVSDTKISGLLPDFFILKYRSLSLSVKTLLNGHRMLYLSGMPMYYCYDKN